MILEPIEVIDGIYELKKFIKPCGDDMSWQVNQAFKLAHKTIHCEMTLKKMRKHHMRRKKSTLKLLISF